jgi:hypothetical protein
MTINIAVVTSEGLVLGCDSIASVTQYLLNPFTMPLRKTSDGRLRVTFRPEDLMPQVTDARDGVTKMFALADHLAPAAAVTTGLAKLNERSMRSYAGEFLEGLREQSPPLTIKEIATRFLAFMREECEKHYRGSDSSRAKQSSLQE